jgi:ABC-type multidrug transport system fused ATPase/permease subunit
VLLRWFLGTFNEPTELRGASSGYELGILMLLVSMLQTFLGNHGFLIISTLGVKQRAVIMTLLYRKALRLSNESRQTSSVGQIVNLMSNDANRFPEFSMFVIRIWMVPIYLLIALSQLFSLLGAPALAGVVVLVMGGWINAQVMKRLHKLRTTQLSATDDRVMQTNEAILGIRIVKMNCWEEPLLVFIVGFFVGFFRPQRALWLGGCRIKAVAGGHSGGCRGCAARDVQLLVQHVSELHVARRGTHTY